MPWLWDLSTSQANTSDGSVGDVDWQKVYVDLRRRSHNGCPDSILGLVNRRRIWNVCRQIAGKYVAAKYSKEEGADKTTAL